MQLCDLLCATPCQINCIYHRGSQRKYNTEDHREYIQFNTQPKLCVTLCQINCICHRGNATQRTTENTCILSRSLSSVQLCDFSVQLCVKLIAYTTEHHRGNTTQRTTENTCNLSRSLSSVKLCDLLCATLCQYKFTFLKTTNLRLAAPCIVAVIAAEIPRASRGLPRKARVPPQKSTLYLGKIIR